MSELAVTASEMRERFADLLENLDRGRVLVKKYGQDRAYLVGVREFRALEETIAVLESRELMRGLQRALDDVREWRVEDVADAFAELDAEFSNEE